MITLPHSKSYHRFGKQNFDGLAALVRCDGYMAMYDQIHAIADFHSDYRSNSSQDKEMLIQNDLYFQLDSKSLYKRLIKNIIRAEFKYQVISD